MRVSAGATLVLLLIYHALRLAAAQCRGAACDWYIPFSLLLPIAVLVMVGVTSGIALSSRPRPGSAWTAAIAITGLLGVAGPLLALAARRDSPDALVITATLLFVLCPITVLAYAWFGRRA